jgi:hypothetical protein
MSLFLFLAVGAVAVFTAGSISQWLAARESERRMSERFALLRKISDQSVESAQLIVDLLREDEAREERAARARARKARKDALAAGLILIATGVGLAIMLAAIRPAPRPMWTIGVIPMLIGTVVFLLAWFDKTPDAPPEPD